MNIIFMYLALVMVTSYSEAVVLLLAVTLLPTWMANRRAPTTTSPNVPVIGVIVPGELHDCQL